MGTDGYLPTQYRPPWWDLQRFDEIFWRRGGISADSATKLPSSVLFVSCRLWVHLASGGFIPSPHLGSAPDLLCSPYLQTLAALLIYYQHVYSLLDRTNDRKKETTCTSNTTRQPAICNAAFVGVSGVWPLHEMIDPNEVQKQFFRSNLFDGCHVFWLQFFFRELRRLWPIIPIGNMTIQAFSTIYGKKS